MLQAINRAPLQGSLIIMALLLLKWPKLATLVEILGTSHNYIINTHVNVPVLYYYIKVNKNLRVPGLIIQFL
jgi:hypothetical protein